MLTVSFLRRLRPTSFTEVRPCRHDLPATLETVLSRSANLPSSSGTEIPPTADPLENSRDAWLSIAIFGGVRSRACRARTGRASRRGAQAPGGKPGKEAEHASEDQAVALGAEAVHADTG